MTHWHFGHHHHHHGHHHGHYEMNVYVPPVNVAYPVPNVYNTYNYGYNPYGPPVVYNGYYNNCHRHC
uniref:Spore coat protein n=1 Tax=Acrobeloides nanus TaxID=290746 RepID=A0A914CH77_9BILA